MGSAARDICRNAGGAADRCYGAMAGRLSHAVNPSM
jgi:hypothetical protein